MSHRFPAPNAAGAAPTRRGRSCRNCTERMRVHPIKAVGDLGSYRGGTR